MFGSTGGLGFEVAKGLVTAEGFDSKKAVVRDASSDKAAQLKEMGWELVQVKNILNDSDALDQALAGSKVGSRRSKSLEQSSWYSL